MNRKQKNKQLVESVADTGAFAIGSVLRFVLKGLLTLFFIFIMTGLLFACVFAYYVKNSLSTDIDYSLDDVSLALSSTIWYTDSDGTSHELVTLHSSENRIWVDYEDIPAYMEHATVAIEDQRFYEHKGVDWYRTAGAFVNMFLSMSDTFGGSTLTQQLIKNITHEDDVTVQRKLLEIFRALEFEKTYTKQEIILWYLNTVYFGSGCYGVGTAANEYFGKEVSELSVAECAAIIGITNNPSLYSPYASRENNKERQEIILHEMYEQGYLTYDEYISAKNEELVFQQGENAVTTQEIYTWYEEAVIDDVLEDLMEAKDLSLDSAKLLLYQGGLQIYACIDPRIQDIVDTVYGWNGDLSNIPVTYGSDQQLQSACVILNPYTGDIVAMAGGVGQKTGNDWLNRATDSKRPPGSSFKPIATYGPAMELGLITQTTIVNDSPNIVLSGISNWYPRNSGGYSGPITIRSALIQSKNTVSAQILDKLGLETSYNFLKEKLGVTSLVEEDCSYAPLSLGQLTYGITVREMAQAYDAFVNDGTFTYSRTYTHITDADGNMVYENTPVTISAFSPNTAWNMCDMLQAAVAGGTGTEAYFSTTAVGGKTGTTSDDNDRYFVGFTKYYVCAVWTGYDYPEALVVSGNPAAQIFRKIMVPVHEGFDYMSFTTPTIGSPTNIFGDMEEVSPSPSEEVSPSPSEEVSPSPSSEEVETPTPDTPVSTAPVTDTPVATVPPTVAPEPDTPVVDEPIE